jgi:hypothetical protein
VVAIRPGPVGGVVDGFQFVGPNLSSVDKSDDEEKGVDSIGPQAAKCFSKSLARASDLDKNNRTSNWSFVESDEVSVDARFLCSIRESLTTPRYARAHVPSVPQVPSHCIFSTVPLGFAG